MYRINNFKKLSFLSFRNFWYSKNIRNPDFQKNRSSFTLIELLVVLALVAILSVVVVMTLNPAELLKQARDSNRLSDLSTINTALNLFSTDVTAGFMGTSTVIYVSLPDNTSSTCGSLGLPALPAGYTYNCVTQANLRNTNGTGWIPVNFQQISSNSPISQLPIDPQNTTSTKYYTYITGGSWKVMATPESQKYLATAANDGGVGIGQFEMGNNMSLAPFTDGLIGWWKFDEEGGATSTDSSGFGHDGSASGTSVVAGKAGNARNFSGQDSVKILNQPVLSPAYITMIAWVKPSAFTGFAINKEGQYRLISNGCISSLCVLYRTQNSAWGSGLNGSGLSSNNWQMLAATYDGNFWKLYSNGNLNAAKAQTTALHSASANLYIGSLGGANYGFSGTIDEVRIYNRAISATEILAIYNETK